MHPHFDKYELHIEVEDELFIKAKNADKGQATIDMCKLWRPLYVDRRARTLSLTQGDRHTRALARVQRTGISPEEINDFMDYIDELTEMLNF